MKRAGTPALALGRDQLWTCLLCKGREDQVGGRHQDVTWYSDTQDVTVFAVLIRSTSVYSKLLLAWLGFLNASCL